MRAFRPQGWAVWSEQIRPTIIMPFRPPRCFLRFKACIPPADRHGEDFIILA